MNGRTKFSLSVCRCIAGSLFFLLTTAWTLLGSSIQEIGNEHPDSSTSLKHVSPTQDEIKLDGIIPESTAQVENILQEDLSDSIPKWYTMITKVPSDWSLFVNRTFRIESIPAIAGLAGVTGALYLVDQNTYSNTHEYERRSRRFRSLSGAIISAGDGKYQFGFVGSLALYGFIADDSRALRTASQMTEAILATGIVVQVLKRVTGRESPIVATQDRGVVRPFPNLVDYERHQPKYYSFPSGHIATTTAALTVLCENFPEAKWMRPMSYILIGAVGGGLVSKGWHWYSDLPLGIALGYSFGVIAAHPEGLDIKKSNSDNSLDVSVAPKLSSSGAKLEMTVHF